MDEWGEPTFSEDLSLACKIMERESDIEITRGTVHKSKHLIVTDEEVQHDDLVQLYGSGPWLRIIKTTHMKSPYSDGLNQWVLYV